MSMRGFGSLYLPFPNFLGNRYFCGCILDDLKFSIRGALVALGRTLRLFKSSHFRCFLLLRHFALMLPSPDITKGTSNVTIKRIAQKTTENQHLKEQNPRKNTPPQSKFHQKMGYFRSAYVGKIILGDQTSIPRILKTNKI